MAEESCTPPGTPPDSPEFSIPVEVKSGVSRDVSIGNETGTGDAPLSVTGGTSNGSFVVNGAGSEVRKAPSHLMNYLSVSRIASNKAPDLDIPHVASPASSASNLSRMGSNNNQLLDAKHPSRRGIPVTASTLARLPSRSKDGGSQAASSRSSNDSKKKKVGLCKHRNHPNLCQMCQWNTPGCVPATSQPGSFSSNATSRQTELRTKSSLSPNTKKEEKEPFVPPEITIRDMVQKQLSSYKPDKDMTLSALVVEIKKQFPGCGELKLVNTKREAIPYQPTQCMSDFPRVNFVYTITFDPRKEDIFKPKPVSTGCCVVM